MATVGTDGWPMPTGEMVSWLRSPTRLCLATWQRLAANDWLMVPGVALLRFGQLPDTAAGAGPGMFAQPDPAIVERVLGDAGWADIEVRPTAVTLRLGRDATEATDYLVGTGIARAVLETIALSVTRRQSPLWPPRWHRTRALTA